MGTPGLLAILTPDERADVVEQWFRSAGGPARRDALLDLASRWCRDRGTPRLRDAVLTPVAGPEPPADRARRPRACSPHQRADPATRPPRRGCGRVAADRTDSPPWHSALLHVADHLFTRRQMLEELR